MRKRAKKSLSTALNIIKRNTGPIFAYIEKRNLRLKRLPVVRQAKLHQFVLFNLLLKKDHIVLVFLISMLITITELKMIALFRRLRFSPYWRKFLKTIKSLKS